MKPAEIMERATKDGLAITVSNDGNIEMIGDEEAVNNWIETIRENKAAILAELEPMQDLHPCKVFTPSLGNAACNVSVTPEVTQQPFNECSTDVQHNEISAFSRTVSDTQPINNELDTDCLQAPYKPLASPSQTQSGGKYSVSVIVTDASTDPVRLSVSINGLGSLDMEIPKARYDGIAILELMELHSMERNAA